MFMLQEQPWKRSEMNKLAVANELLLYVVLVLLLACESLSTTSSSHSETLGWVMVAVITLFIHLNVIVILAEAWYHTKLVYTRIANSKTKYNSKTVKVVPRKLSVNLTKN